MIWRLKEPAQHRSPDVVLGTTRLIVRPAMISDYNQWKEVRERNQPFLKPYEPTWPPKCLEAEFFKRRTERLNRDWLSDFGYAFLIFLQDGNDLVGGVNINNVTRGAAQFASLGYWLDEPSQGHGYMTEAGKAVLDFAFNKISLARMNAATLTHNQKSRAMLARLGFKEEGFAKAYIQIDGKRQDHVLFGLSADDFLSAS